MFRHIFADKMSNSGEKKETFRKITLVTLLTVISLIFVTSGILKFSPPEFIIINFTKWDLKEWMVYIGIAELVGVVLIIKSTTRLLGTLILTGLMAGAIQTHYVNSEPFYFHISVIVVLWTILLVINKKSKLSTFNE